MKKLLSLLGSALFIASAGSSVVACGSRYQDGSLNRHYVDPLPGFDEQRREASFIARSKAMIVSDAFGLSEDTTKNFIFTNTTVGNYFGFDPNDPKAQEVSNENVGTKFTEWFDDEKLGSIKNLNSTGSVGEKGGALLALKDAGLNAIFSKLNITDAKTQGIIKNVLDSILELSGVDLSKTALEISVKLVNLLNYMQPVDSKIAFTGIPVALDMLPNLNANPAVFSLLNTIFNGIKGSIAAPLEKFLDGLTKASDVSSEATQTIAQAPEEIEGILENLVKNGTSPSTSDVLKFISLSGLYLSFFNQNDNDKSKSGIDLLKEKSSMKLNSSVLYKESKDEKGNVVGTTFNLIPLLNEAAYYLSNGIDENKIQKLCQILFLTTDGDQIVLNKMGKFLFEKNGNVGGQILSLINLVMKGKPITAEKAENEFVFGITNGQYGSDEDKVFPDSKKSWNVIFNDWEQFGNGFGEALTKNSTIKGMFFDDTVMPEDGKTDAAEIDMSLKSLLDSLPIYKFIYADSVVSGEKNNGYSTADLNKQGGLLPNQFGYYTQKSISALAKEMNSTFNLNSDTAHTADMKNHYFDFYKLSQLAKQLFDGDNAIINAVINSLNKDDGDTYLGEILGYEIEEDHTNNEGKKKIKKVNANSIKTNSFMGQLITLLVPGLDTTGKDHISVDDLTPELLRTSDALKVFFDAGASFVKNALSGTNYEYWENKILKDTAYDNSKKGYADSVWYFKQDGDIPFTTSYDEKAGIQHYTKGNKEYYTLVMTFNIGRFDSLINRLNIQNKESTNIYKITATRPKGDNGQFVINGFEKLGW